MDAQYPICPKSMSKEDIPFIPAEDVKLRDGKNGSRLWLVIDDIVYDCTEFIEEHPGGEEVIQNFGGQNCSWQWWRFHNVVYLRNHADYLRVGKTSGLENRYKEPAKYRGLRGFSADDL